MTELEFGERLKQYRRARNMTQQELADLLGVSNKSVSRWESGSYPDVATLGPLAHALGVTVDDLLGVSPPLRSLERADWQNLLSFAFAIGGGVLFFLLDLFAPALVCYLLYLGAMAYGVYLQRHYTYHSKWFHRGNLVMNFFVNFQLFAPLFALCSGLSYASLNSFFSGMASLRDLFLTFLSVGVLPPLLVWVVLSGAATAVTWLVIRRNCSVSPEQAQYRLRLGRAPFTAAKALPALCPVLAALYWCLFYSESLPAWLYLHQEGAFYAVLLGLFLLSALWLLLKRQPWMLIPALAVTLASSLFAGLLTYPLAWSKISARFVENTGVLNHSSYIIVGRPAAELFVAAAILAAVYLLCCTFHVYREKKDEKN